MSNKMSSVDTDPESQVFEEDELASLPHSTSNSSSDTVKFRKLSTISKQYDVNGDGVLDAAELAMRDMDKSNRGYLTNEKVYKLMQEQLETQKQLFRVKRVMFVLLALVVILALSNLGTSMAAAYLSKDTTNSENAELLDKATNEQLSTQTTTDVIPIDRTLEITEDGRRRLCSNEDGGVDCEVKGERTFLSVDAKMCRKMVRNCNRGNTVSLSRSWPNGSSTTFNVCPHTSGTMSRSNPSTLTNGKGQEFKFEPVEGEHCEVYGEALQQRQGDICLVDLDCAPGLGCEKVQSLVDACQARCYMKRWAKRLADQCALDCDHPSCQAQAVSS